MAIQQNAYPVRIDKTIMEKAKSVAAFYGRSLNKEIEFRLREAVIAFEREYGEIKTDSD